MYFWRSDDGHGRYHGTRAEEIAEAAEVAIKEEEKEAREIHEAIC